MKTRLPRQEFVDALTAVAAIAGGRTTKPILGCVRLATEGETLELGGSDGEAALHLSIGTFAVDQPGEAVVPVERLLAIVREMPDPEIRVDADEKHCVVRGAGSEFKIFVFPPADFPPIPTFGDEPDLIMDGGQLARMINLTIYAAARETGRYAINGVLWQKRGKRLYLVATDGRRLARAGGNVTQSKAQDFEAIVPCKALHAFERVFTGKDRGDWQVEIQVLPNQVLLRSGDRMLATALVEGTFPKYDDVIPKDSDKVAQVARLELHGAIRRAALLTSDEARAVKLAFGSGQLIITAHSVEQGEARVELPIEYQGEPLEIGFNAAFVSDALKVLPYESVNIELKESFRPGILRGEDKTDFLYVIMPVSL